MCHVPFETRISASAHLRVDGVLGDVSLDAEVVSSCHKGVEGHVMDMSSDLLHTVSQHPGPSNHLANTAHGLGVTADHTDRAHVVQAALGRDGLATDTTFSKVHVLGQVLIQMVADHQHVDVLVESVLGEGQSRRGTGGQNVGLATDSNDVGGVSASSSFRVVGVNRASIDGAHSRLHKSGFVQGIGVNSCLIKT